MPAISSPHRGCPQSVPAVFQALAQQPTPALIFYGQDGGRVELSGRVLENWVSKTANLLVDDLGLMPGDRILVEPAVHWRTAVVVAGAWRVGATVILADSPHAQGTESAVAVALQPLSQRPCASSGEPAFGAGAQDLMVLAYPALAMSVEDGQLPDGAIDFCAEIRAHGDHYADAGASPTGSDTALVAEDGELSFSNLLTQAQQHAESLNTQAGTPTAVHLDTTTWGAVDLARLLATWMTGSTAVITDCPSTEVAHLMTTERVGLTWS